MNTLFRQPENLSPQASKRDIRRTLRLARKRQPENARRAAERAATCLEALPDNEVRRAMRDLAELSVARLS